MFFGLKLAPLSLLPSQLYFYLGNLPRFLLS